MIRSLVALLVLTIGLGCYAGVQFSGIGEVRTSAISVSIEDGRRNLFLCNGCESISLSGEACLRDEPALWENQIAWIEETTTTARVRLRTETETATLAQAPRGWLLDVAMGGLGTGWSEFNGQDWDVCLWRDGQTSRWNGTGSEEGEPAVGTGFMAWITCQMMDIHVSLFRPDVPLLSLPGNLPEHLFASGNALFWFSWSPRGPKGWIYDENGPRMVTTDQETIRTLWGPQPVSQAGNPTLEWKVQWTRQEIQSPPLPRTTHATVAIGGGKVLVFGGEVWDEGSQVFQGLDNALHILHPAERAWGRFTPEVSPQQRCHIPLGFDPEHETVLLWGGAGFDDQQDFILLGDTWLLNTKTLTWKEVKTNLEGTPPAAANAALVYEPGGQRFLLFLESGAWEFSMKDSAWRRWNLPPGPAPRVSASVALDPAERKLFFFGGNTGSRYFDDTWILNLESMEWREVVTTLHPAARVRPAHAINSKEHLVALYGGVRGQFSERFEDLWLFDMHAECWMLVSEKDSSSPGKRGGFEGMAFDPGSEVFTLFGGRSDKAQHHNDTWQLRLSRNTP